MYDVHTHATSVSVFFIVALVGQEFNLSYSESSYKSSQVVSDVWRGVLYTLPSASFSLKKGRYGESSPPTPPSRSPVIARVTLSNYAERVLFADRSISSFAIDPRK